MNFTVKWHLASCATYFTNSNVLIFRGSGLASLFPIKGPGLYTCETIVCQIWATNTTIISWTLSILLIAENTVYLQEKSGFVAAVM